LCVCIVQRVQMQWRPWTGETSIPAIVGWRSGVTFEPDAPGTALAAERVRRKALRERRTDQDMIYLVSYVSRVVGRNR
jgi:hypothetical protein